MDLEVYHENKQITTVSTIRFLGLIIDSALSWKQHIDSIIPKLNRACFAIRQVKSYMALESLKTIYFSYFHSIIMYVIIFWGNSVHSQYIFKIKKKNDQAYCKFGSKGILSWCFSKIRDFTFVFAIIIFPTHVCS